MKIYLIKKPGSKSLTPVNQADLDAIHKLKVNTVYRVELRKPRNYKHHALIFSLAKCTLENLPEDRKWSIHYKNNPNTAPYEFIKGLMFDMGLTEKRRSAKGEMYEVEKSISFESLSEDEFEPISNMMFRICAEILQITENELRKNYIKYIEGV